VLEELLRLVQIGPLSYVTISVNYRDECRLLGEILYSNVPVYTKQASRAF